jgi:putative membrane protein
MDRSSDDAASCHRCIRVRVLGLATGADCRCSFSARGLPAGGAASDEVGPFGWHQRCGSGVAAALHRLVLLGVAVFVWTSCGFLQVYGRSLYWVWTPQALTLLLLVPVLLMAGQPAELLRRLRGRRSGVVRLLDGRIGLVLSSPVIGPVVVPLTAAALFFGPIAGGASAHAANGWVLDLALLSIGAVIALPLVDVAEAETSLAIGLAMAVGMFELVLDAMPGIVLRLQTKTVTGFFDVRVSQPWAQSPVHDQQLAGAILWGVAEIVDIPFLILVFRRWVRADAREAAELDGHLDRAAPTTSQEAGLSGDQVPQLWWMCDPALRERFQRERQ